MGRLGNVGGFFGDCGLGDDAGGGDEEDEGKE